LSDAAPPSRKRRRVWIYSAAGAALIAAGAGIGLGPAAPWVVDNFADGARVWRLGRINVDGVSGGWLGNLRAEHITIADDDGIWIEVRDVALDWRPHYILAGGVRLNDVRAASIVIHRQPTLLPARPPSGASFDIRIGALHVDAIDLAEPVVGAAAAFTADLALTIDSKALEHFDFTLTRTDSDADRVIARYGADEDFALHVDAVSAPGGVIARLLGIADEGVRATANGAGDAQTGSAEYQADIGGAELLAGQINWTPREWRIESTAQLDRLPALQTIARRIGPSVVLNAHGAFAGAFEAHAETPFLALDLEGELDEDGALDGPAQLVATTERLSDIARESPFELGAARLEGELRRARGTTAIRGTLDAQTIEALGQRARLAGPVEASLNADRFALNADLRAPADTAPLFTQARLRTALAYDRQRRRRR
jgi:translocation and assembly module TamB